MFELILRFLSLLESYGIANWVHTQYAQFSV